MPLCPPCAVRRSLRFLTSCFLSEVVFTPTENQRSADPVLLSPLTLAFVGDVVYELMVRRQLVEGGSMPVGKLHARAVEQVNATAQAAVYHRLEPVLDPLELSILKRGRNAHTGRTPKNATAIDYRKATGVEALFGYLYLSGKTERLAELFDIIGRPGGEEEPTDGQK